MQPINVLMMRMIIMMTIVLVLLVGVLVVESDDMDDLLIELKLYPEDKKTRISSQEFLWRIDVHTYGDKLPTPHYKPVKAPLIATLRDKGDKLFSNALRHRYTLSELRSDWKMIFMDDADWVYEQLLQVGRCFSGTIYNDVVASKLIKQNKNPVPDGCTREALKKRAELFKEVNRIDYIRDGTEKRNPHGLKLYLAKVLHLAASHCCYRYAHKVVEKQKNDQEWLRKCGAIAGSGISMKPSERLALVKDKLAPFLAPEPEESKE